METDALTDAGLVLPPGTVRPRYRTDEGDSLPLVDLVDEVIAPDRRGRLLVRGPRGSGLTTALRVLAAAVAERSALRPLPFERLWSDPSGETLGALARAQAVLIVDLSVTPLEPDRWRRIRRVFAEGLPGVVGSEEAARAGRLLVAIPDEIAAPPETWLPAFAPTRECRLAEWTGDDLLELLAAPAYVNDRARLFASLRAIPALAGSLARARACRWLVDAALALGPGEPCTQARLYANVLDTLAPETLELLAELGDGAFEALQAEVRRHRRPHAPELAALFEQAYVWARAHADPGDQAVAELRRSGLLGDGQRLEGREPGEDGVSREALRSARREALGEPRSLLDARGRLRSPGELGGQERVRHAARLALPGLQWFLQAGRCLEAVARGRAPNELRRAWLPFVPDLLSPGARDHLRSWCRGTPAMGRAASLLWAAGEAPPLARTRRSVLDGAILPSIVLPEVDFSAARIVRSDLSGATLTGASFSEARVERTALEGADLADATFVGARLRGVRLAGASLRGASLDGADLLETVLRGADLTCATAEHAALASCDLTDAVLQDARLSDARLLNVCLKGADLRRANLSGATFADVEVAGSRFQGADLQDSTFRHVDLRRTRLTHAYLRGASFNRCALTNLVLERWFAAGVTLQICELSDVFLPGADLRGAAFHLCRAHGANFEGADLQGATFSKVNFQAGSSRAGLLLGKPALEGSMAGFYAEGTTDDAWASPESLRTASFRGADLRGARFPDTDLFRIDFRGAKLDADLRYRALQQGAIVDRA